MPMIQVTGQSPYNIHIGYDITGEVAGRVKDIGARKVAIIHQQPLSAVARAPVVTGCTTLSLVGPCARLADCSSCLRGPTCPVPFSEVHLGE